MHNLADYGSSDEDDKVCEFNSKGDVETTPGSSGTLFKKLPQPTCSDDTFKKVITDECELEADVTRKRDWMAEKESVIPASKKSKTVKIILPSILDLGDEDSDNDDGPAISTKSNLRQAKSNNVIGSALLSLLPQPSTSYDKPKASPLFMPREQALKKVSTGGIKPTTTASFAPRSVEQKPKTGTSAPAKSSVDAAPSIKLAILADYGSDQSGDSDDEANLASVADKKETREQDFFGLTSTNVTEQSLSAPTDLEAPDVSSFDICSTSNNVGDMSLAFDQKDAAAGPVHPSQMYNLASVSETEGLGETKDDMDYVKRLIYENEIEKLSDGHTYVLPDDLEIQDVQVDSHLGPVRENLLKNITCAKAPDAMLVAAQMAAATGGGGKSGKKAKPDPTAKRKHQITYLAHLAKEREEALQNQWAQNKQKRRDAQSKYGFR